MQPRARVLAMAGFLPTFGGGWATALARLLFFSAADKPPADAEANRGTNGAAESSRGTLRPDDLVADLTERFWERLRLFATRRLRDVALAEDVAQEVLRRTLEALRGGRVLNPEALPAFLFQTARNVCMQRARSMGRESRALQRMGSGDEGSPEPDPLVGLISRERGEAVHAALARLDAEDRDLLAMYYGEALDSDEIAQRLGISAGAVRVRKHRALARLTALLGVTKRRHRELLV